MDGFVQFRLADSNHLLRISRADLHLNIIILILHLQHIFLFSVFAFLFFNIYFVAASSTARSAADLSAIIAYAVSEATKGKK